MAGATKEPTLYELLGVPSDADTAAIKKAYRSAARKVHPDVNPGFESMFLMVQHAYEVLSDERRRREYDSTIGQSRPSSSSGPSAPPRDDGPPAAPGSSDRASGGSHGASQGSYGAPSASGAQVPPEQYSGPLPREVHDLGAMPWIGAELGEVRIANRETPMRARLVLAAVAGILVLIGLIGNPLSILAVLAVGAFLGLRQFGFARGFAAWGFTLAFMAGTLLVPVMYVTALHNPRYGMGNIVAGAVGLLGLLLLIAGHSWWQRHRHWMRSQFVRDGFVWGDPGEGLLKATEKFGITDVMDGIEGERLTAAEVAWFLSSIPGVRLVNGLAFPGSKNADIDHAAVCGDKIAFLDSKAWSPGAFTIGRDWVSIREDQPGGGWRYRETHMHNAVDAYAKDVRRFGVRDAKIRGYIVVHPKTLDRPLTLDSSSSSEYNRIVTARQLIAELGAWFTEDAEQARTVDRRTLSFLVGSMKD